MLLAAAQWNIAIVINLVVNLELPVDAATCMHRWTGCRGCAGAQAQVNARLCMLGCCTTRTACKLPAALFQHGQQPLLSPRILSCTSLPRRVGRAGRFGTRGLAVTLLEGPEQLARLESYLQEMAGGQVCCMGVGL